MLEPENLFWLALTVYHEARGETSEGQKAVVKVILNRAKSRGWPLKNIVLARKQFSCYNLGFPHPTLYIKELETFQKVLSTCFEGTKEWEDGDTLRGATHYYALRGMVDHKPPYWASSMTFITEPQGHKFFKETL